MSGLQAYQVRLEQNLKEQREKSAAGTQETSQSGQLTKLPGMDTFDPNATVLPDPKPSFMTKLFQGMSLALEPLDRVTQATREVALFANKVTTLDGFKRRFTGALNGDVKRMSRQEFAELMVGSETYNAMENTPFIPGWFKAVATPEQALIGGTRRPKVSVATMFSLGLDFAVDPFTLLSLTPVGAGSKLGGAISKAVLFPFRPVTKGLDKLIGPRSNSPLSFLNFARQPEDVLPTDMFQAIAASKFKMDDNLSGVLKKTQDIFKGISYRGKDDQALAAALHGLKVGKDGLLRGGKTKLTGNAKRVYDEVIPIINSTLDDLVKSGAIKKSELGNAPLAAFYPKLVGKHSIPTDIWQSWDASKIGVMNLKIRKKGVNQGPIEFENLSGIDSIRDFIYGARRKLDLEPILRRFAPGKDLAAQALEDPLTQSLSKFQRRYLTDVINEFTGNNKGRKMIEFDMLVGDFFHRLEQTPVGGRIAKLYHKLGNGTTADGLADFSTTTKLAGMWSHNIIRATLGGNLSSAVQNLTQTLNTAVARGMPNTIKGMLKFSDPKLRRLRSEANLQRDFHAIWNEGMWVSAFGKRYDDVLMAPFNAAENVIRGTGFHVGINSYLKKNKLKSIDEAIRLGHKEKMMNFAHFESINGAFIYGTLGRPPALSNPLIRPATTLLSYPFKQAEFLRRSFMNDGTALLRFIGLHGFLIEHANHEFNIAAEDFLGWGFKPMTRSFGGIPLVASPPVAVALDIASGLEAYGQGDLKRAEKLFKKVTRDMPIALGAAGAPILGIKDIAKLREQVVTKRQEIGQDGFENITTKEAWTNYIIGRSTTQKMRSDLKRRMLRAERKVAFTQDKAARKFVDAIFGDSGDDVAQAAWEAAQGIEIEGKLFYTPPEMFTDRVNTLMEKRVIGDDLRTMMSSGFIEQIYIQASLELYQRSSSN